MGTIVLPLSKSPWPGGRVGKLANQDWMKGCEKAVRFQKNLSTPSEILILTDFQATGQPHEADVMREVLEGLGAENLREIREGNETIGQLDYVFALALRESKDLVIISTFLHYPRVRWISWWGRVKGYYWRKAVHKIAFGIPRPKEAITDLGLSFIFPLIDLMGERDWFLQKVKDRRESGIH